MRIVFSGGGTAGHINPAIAIANYIKDKYTDSEILFIGTKDGFESRIVPEAGYDIKYIKARGFKRRLSLNTFLALKEFVFGYIKAGRILKKFKPDIVIGTGGYVSGAVLMKAVNMKIPTMVQEQNAFPGITNKLLGKKVDAVALAFEEGAKYFAGVKKVECTGNPVKKEVLNANRVDAREKLGLSENDKMLLITSGSRGAETVNLAVSNMIKKHIDEGKFKIYMATGRVNYEEVKKQLGEYANKITLVDYINNMYEIYAASDLVLCRAGAMTVSELVAIGKPAIFIPSPYVTANHQEYNARTLVDKNAAKMILEKDLNEDILYEVICDVISNDDKLKEMGQNAKKCGIVNSLEKIEEIIESIVKR